MKLRLRESIIILIILFALAMLIMLTKARGTNKEITGDLALATIVDNSTDFYDVSGIVDKYINALIDKNTDDIMLMLDKKYLKENRINKSNLYQYVSDLSNNMYTFSPLKMYYYDINDNLSKFYVHGHLDVESIDYNTDYKDFYVIVIIDKDQETFSIIPDDGSVFREVEK